MTKTPARVAPRGGDLPQIPTPSSPDSGQAPTKAKADLLLYLEIENSRLGLELREQRPWLIRELALVRQCDSPEAENRRLHAIQNELLAAELMTEIINDLRESVQGAIAARRTDFAVFLKEDQHFITWPAEFTERLGLAWPVCQKLAQIARRASPMDVCAREMADCCRAETSKRGKFKPQPCRIGRSELLATGTNEKKIGAFLGYVIWNAGYVALCRAGHPAAGEPFLLEACDHYEAEEEILLKRNPASGTRKKNQLPRSWLHFQVARHYYRDKEYASAARYAVLTFILDVVGGRYDGEQAKRQDKPLIDTDSTGINSFLWRRFRVGTGSLERLYHAIKKLRRIPEPFSELLRFPEFVHSRLLSDKAGTVYPPELLHLDGRKSQHPLNPRLLRCFKHINTELKGNSPGKSAARGRCLEYWVAYLFSTLEGVRIRANQKASGQPAEIDLLVEFSPKANVWLLQRFKERVAVECKNLGGNVEAQVVQTLVGKITLLGCTSGIIVAGQEDFSSSAKQFVRDLKEPRILLLPFRSFRNQVTPQLDGDAPSDFLSWLIAECEAQWDDHKHKSDIPGI